MTVAYVNHTSINGGSGTSGNGILPGSRVNGNFLIAFIQVFTGSKTISVSSGWTIVDDATDANQSSCWAWRLVDGTETAATFSWSGSATWHADCYQFSGNDTPSPVGAHNKNSGNSTTLSVSAVTTTNPNSDVIALLLTSTNLTIPTPTGYTSRNAFNDGNGSNEIADETVVSSGVASDAVSVSVTSGPWSGFIIELKGPPPPPPPPSYVNAGSFNSGTSGTATSGLPGSRVNGNLLISLVYVSGGAVNFAIGGGWTIGGHLNAGSGGDAAWAWYEVDGAEAAPSWTIDLTTWRAKCFQYTGSVAPHIGAKNTGQGSSATLAVSAITTTADNSTVVGLLTTPQATTIPTPSGYTVRDTDSSGSSLVVDETESTAGTPSDAVSVSIPSGAWSGFLIELLSVAPSTPSFTAAGALVGI